MFDEQHIPVWLQRLLLNQVGVSSLISRLKGEQFYGIPFWCSILSSHVIGDIRRNVQSCTLFHQKNMEKYNKIQISKKGFLRFLKRLLPITLGLVIFLIIFYEIYSSIDHSEKVVPDPIVNYSRISWAGASRTKVLVNDSAARLLERRIKILCLVPTEPAYEESRALAVNKTWGIRCSEIVFVSTQPLTDLPHIVLNIPQGRNHLTAKTVSMFEYAYQRYIDDFDWFLKADDDTFIVMENLRYLLSHIKPKTPAYLGFHYKNFVKQGYMSGGAGYVISQEALRMLGRKGLRDSSMCSQDGWGEDIDFGKCIENRGIRPFSTKDVFGRETFLPLKLQLHIVGPIPFRKQFEEQIKRKTEIGPSCCSQLTVSFHYVTPDEMYQLEFLLYRMHVYGRHIDDVVFKDFVKPKPIVP